ncbi:sulfotransferase [Alteromonas sp.]|uniref:sulfotransferase family protein n=1 Tax=Alteromonas sp. TaxID=232 RepID=UPI000B6FBB36|nr:sulfotransferase [Alteromonas sp.]MAI37323.1 hypothetical protein [Alteromonas sp.]OUX88907.1 MAG: hypothetical protein CBB95_06685 [Alteromonas sp. TMED35]|tara:strand:+ start:22545 stop:23420 length:876 start_codon:yes stop_codon:yes gene_type:complete
MNTISYPDVILLGTQRSGTTLLTRMLSAHSQLFIQNEISVEEVFTHTSPDKIIEHCNEQIRKRHGLPISELLKRENKTLWGFKDPQLTEHLSALEPFLKTTKFITIVRDPRGVVNSYIDNKWGLGTTAYTGAIRWRNEVLAQESFMQKEPKQCLYIRYEDLVTKQEETLRKVCTHLEIPFENSLIEYHKKKAQFKLNASNINTNKGATGHFSIRWKNELAHRQISEIEYVADELMLKNGYSLTTSAKKPHTLRRFYYRLHQAVIGEFQIQYQLRKFAVKQFLSKKSSSANA